ncbi:hypothetical protein BTBSAS_200037 [Brochothrix thermosphacta]|uniref:Uncharacterized protein n=1 Tax=Brochothrix thermosphacta TaxID=2756 RepID=A0A2X0R340_BROTH|nr:hypothetical protein BTBSAS_200037 [Brochothrix thermosphacta]
MASANTECMQGANPCLSHSYQYKGWQGLPFRITYGEEL